MPNCGCFHKYELNFLRPTEYELEIDLEGHCALNEVLVRAELAETVTEKWGWLGPSFEIKGVADEEQLKSFLDALVSILFVDLSPELSECFALTPYTMFDDESNPERTNIGELLHVAKYQRGHTEASRLGQLLGEFVLAHPTLRRVDAVAAPPKSDLNTPNLPSLWCTGTANMLGIENISVSKTTPTAPQKIVVDEETEEEKTARLAGTMRAEAMSNNPRVLIIDDTIGAGTTLKEVARTLRQQGASRVFGLTVAKDARLTLGGLSLRKDLWS